MGPAAKLLKSCYQDAIGGHHAKRKCIRNEPSLMDLRKRVDESLLKQSAKLERQLEKMGSAIAVVGGRGGGSALKGRKVPPKYRGPSGETWSGRGVKPRWLVAAIKGGKKLDDFLIDKSARKRRKKRRSKR
jgi:DNA-binding protein H-NS